MLALAGWSYAQTEPSNRIEPARVELGAALETDPYSANIALAYFEYSSLRMDLSLAHSREASRIAKSPEQKTAATLARAYAWWGRESFDIAYELVSGLDPKKLIRASDRVRFFALRGWLEGVLAEPKLAGQNFRQALREAKGHPELLMEVRLAWLSTLLSLERWDSAESQLLEAHRLSPLVNSLQPKFRLSELESRLDAKLGAESRAIARLQDSITLAGLTQAAVWEARLQHRQAVILARESRFDLALQRLEVSEATLVKNSLSSELPQLTTAWLNYFYLREDDFQGVEKKALELAKMAGSPHDRFRMLELARSYSLDGGESATEQLISLRPRLKCQRQRMRSLHLEGQRARAKGEVSLAMQLFSKAETLARQRRAPNLPPSVPGRQPSLLQIAESRIYTEFPHRGPSKLVALKEELTEPATPQSAYDRSLLRGEALGTAIHLFDIDEALTQAHALVKEAPLTPLTAFARNSIEVGFVHILAEGDRRGLQPIPKGYRLGDPAAREVLSRLSREPEFLEEASIILQTKDLSLGGKSSEPHRLAFWGRFLRALGRADEAEVALQRGLKLARQENNKVFIGFLHSELAQHYFARRKIREAIEQLKLALNTAPDRFRAEFLEALIFLEYRAGQRSDSTHRDFLLASAGTSSPHQHFLRGLSHFSLSELSKAKLALSRARKSPRYRAVGDYWTAKVLLSQGHRKAAREILEALVRAEDVSIDPISLSDISLLLGPLLEDQEALKLYRQSAERLLSTGASLGNEDALIGERNQALLKTVVETALELGQDELAFDYLKRVRSLALLDEIRRSNPRGETATLLGRLEQLRRSVAKLESSAEGGSGTALTQTRQEFFTTLTRLQQREPRFKQLVNFRAGDLARVQRLLPPRSLLLMPYPGRQSLRLMAVTPEGFQVLTVPVEAELLKSTVRRYHHLLTLRNTSQNQRAQLGADLYAWLLKPLESKLRNVDTLLFVPTEELWYLPLASLPTSKGSVSDELAVSLLTSSDLLALTQTPKKFRGTEFALLANDLAGASRETAEIAEEFPGSRLLSAEQATSRALIREAQTAQVLHLATHGHVNQKQPGKSFLELADGEFSLTEVYQLALKSGSLVVLSACETGVAEKEPGREVASLANAFMTAGASSVIASLWQVDDAVTRQLFVSFYRHLAHGSGRAEALRRAQQELAADPNTRHPYYWAAFFLAGDPR